MRIAAGKIAGKTHKQIAGELGITKDRVNHLAISPEVQFEISRLLSKLDAKLVKGVERCVDAVLDGLDACVDDKADHRARMAAVAQFRELLALRQGPQVITADRPPGLYYLEEIERRRALVRVREESEE